jgi:hypothetical protein
MISIELARAVAIPASTIWQTHFLRERKQGECRIIDSRCNESICPL